MVMIETLIKQETAILAKEKGFDLKQCEMDYDGYLRPTQSLLQKWLRDKHCIHVGIYIEKNNIVGILTYSWEVFKMFENDFRTLKEDETIVNYLSYEEALEAGLQEALKSI